MPKQTVQIHIKMLQKEQFHTKHAYSNMLKILKPKKENFQIKNSDIFHISTQNIDWGTH